MRSGQEPSDMFIFAPDCKKKMKIDINLIVFKSDIIFYVINKSTRESFTVVVVVGKVERS